LAPEEVEVLRNAAEGYTVAEENGYVAALQTALTEDLILEGLAREAVRRLNNMRRDADYALSDHIAVTYKASDKLGQAIGKHADYIMSDTLTDKLTAADPSGDRVEAFEFDGQTATFGVKRI
jgi:isoleucyl-tRNA synthetase